jgi:hypothetical protein
VAEVLSCEAWYNDVKLRPSWKGAPSSDQAKCRRLRYIKRLSRFIDQFSVAKDLAGTLDSCHPNHRCMSGACPECSRAFQRWFVHETKNLVRDLHGATELITASIVFPNGRTPVESISSSLSDSGLISMCQTSAAD